MSGTLKISLALAGVMVLTAGGLAFAQDHPMPGEDHGVPRRPATERAAPEQAAPDRPMSAPRGEPHPGPSGYQRPAEPKGWNARPASADHAAYQHNFQAARSYHVGPYHQPEGWTDHRWSYGETLPSAYWTAQYFLADYWLFGLETPPVNYEWVRDGEDALLIDTATGEILQVEYGVFA